MRKSKGFSLIELLLAMGLMMMLSAGIVVLIGRGPVQAGRDSRRKADLEKVASALELYRNDNGTYPDCSSGNNCTVATTFVVSALWSTYMSTAPTDPSSPAREYRYVPLPVGCDAGGTRCTQYVLCTALEKVIAADAACSGAGSCGAGVNCSGSVTSP